MNKALKITLISLSSIIVLLLLINILISPIATSYVNKNGKELLGRKIQVEKIKINIATGNLKLVDFHLYEEDERNEWISIDTLHLNTNLFRLLTHQLYLQRIHIAGLNLKIIQNDTLFNFTSFLNHFASNTDDTQQDDKKWALAFYNISLSHGEIYYTDLLRKCEWNLDDINFSTPGFSINERSSTKAGLSINLADGGELHTTAKYDVASNNFTLNLKLTELPITNVRAYLEEFMHIGKTNGALSANLVANGNISQLLNTNINGDLKLYDLSIKSDKRDEILSLNQLNINIKKINFNQNLYNINNITIDALKSHFEIYPDGNTFTKLLINDSTTTANTATDSNRKPLKLHINHFSLSNSELTYADYTLPEKFKFPLTNIEILADNLSLHGTNIAHIKASLPHDGYASIAWKGALDDWKSHQDLDLIIENLQLEDLSPYAIQYLRYPFTKGTLSYSSDNHILNSEVSATHHIHINNAQVGKKHNDIEAPFKIPLKTVLYVLSDNDNQINIDLPVTGNLNNPEFKYSKAVWFAIGNMFTKVATEPFRMANNAFGITNQDRYIAINPTDTLFSKSQYRLLEKYAKTLKKEPTLKIHFEQHVDPTSEDFIFTLADKRNQHLHHYLVHELRIDTSQFVITTLDNDDLKKPGYHISGELINE